MAYKERELAWSLSRGRMFRECPRRYYYHYYFANLGKMDDAPQEAVLAAEMKNLKGLDMWVGEIVHRVIENTLQQAKDGSVISPETARAEAQRMLSSGWKSSRLREWRRFRDDDHPNIFEHYYVIDVGEATIARIKEKAYTCVANFMQSQMLQDIAATPGDRWLPLEKYASFRLDGLLMYVKFDFALRDGRQLTLYDWKTGKPTDDERRQLTCYAMYTAEKWDIPVANVKAVAVHLQPEMTANEFLIDNDCLEDLREHVREGFGAMLKCLRNPARNIAAMDDFPMTGNLLRCMRCNFKGVCEQGKVASGDCEDPPPEDWEDS